MHILLCVLGSLYKRTLFNHEGVYKTTNKESKSDDEDKSWDNASLCNYNCNFWMRRSRGARWTRPAMCSPSSQESWARPLQKRLAPFSKPLSKRKSPHFSDASAPTGRMGSARRQRIFRISVERICRFATVKKSLTIFRRRHYTLGQCPKTWQFYEPERRMQTELARYASLWREVAPMFLAKPCGSRILQPD